MDFPRVPVPFYDAEPALSARDPAVAFQDGLYHCYHTAVERARDRFRLYVDVIMSPDLLAWSEPRRIADSRENFSSPGNVFEANGTQYLCVQSYPTVPGGQYGTDDSRLWLMQSGDGLKTFSEPAVMSAQGCRAGWAKSKRQIDPYVLDRGDGYLVYYKTDGKLGALFTGDLVHFEEASPDRPVLSPEQTPDGSTVENPCVLSVDGVYVMFFAPCREGRGIGMAESADGLVWKDVRYLPFPDLPWAPGGPTAPMVFDDRARTGKWLLFFHGDKEGPHGAALAVAHSEDLIHWRL